MRFHEDGPNIPDELISAQRQGKVVFFCGAGVSVPAKLPKFLELARNVMFNLGVSPNSNPTLASQLDQVLEALKPREKPYQLPFSLDQTFYLLQQEYGREAVVHEVMEEVRVKRTANTEGHKVILRLAKNAKGNPQVVTTNFDLLFQYADSSVRSYVPPAMPALGNGEKIEGVVYLHGKWHDTSGLYRVQQNIIISSADFGRAYLAEGWASSFIKELARHHVIVLLGYSADDPPVRYLLEGLHAQSGSISPKIYSFSQGTEEEVGQNWRHRGVTGISFPTFPALWTSLGMWADFSDNTKAWYQATVEMAQSRPSSLKAYQRGQVAFLVSTIDGARVFADAVPPPPAEWLCVFDSRLRNRRPFRNSYIDDEEFYSSQEYFGLDDDVYIASDSEELEIRGRDFLSDLSSDNVGRALVGLTSNDSPLPVRLLHLSRWLVRVLSDPVSLWWAAGSPRLSRSLESMIRDQIRRAEVGNKLLSSWQIFLESMVAEGGDVDSRLFRFRESIKVHGWDRHRVRELETVLSPHFKVQRKGTIPPLDGQAPVEISLQIPNVSEVPSIPSEHLAEVVRSYRVSIEKCVRVTQEIEYYFWPDFLDDSRDISESPRNH